jgi:hypothetical protein
VLQSFASKPISVPFAKRTRVRKWHTSANLTAVWPLGMISVSDRRLTGLDSGQIKTNRSTKMTVFGCADAHGVIVYNGIGMDDAGKTPSEWVMSLAEQQVFDLPLANVLDRIAADVEPRLISLRQKYGSTRLRHTFVVSVWEQDAPAIYCISNYERADENGEASKARENLMLTKSFPTEAKRIQVFSTGSHPFRRDLEAISGAIKAGAQPNSVKALSVKAVKDIAYGRGRGRGVVGASCQWAFVGAKREDVWFGLDVVGGTVAQETPNLINIAANIPLGGTFSSRMGGPGMLIMESYSGFGEEARVARYDPAQKRAVFREPACGICGSPMPASSRSCEVCSYEQHSDRSKKRSRHHA